MLEKLDSHMQKYETRPLSHHCLFYISNKFSDDDEAAGLGAHWWVYWHIISETRGFSVHKRLITCKV